MLKVWCHVLFVLLFCHNPLLPVPADRVFCIHVESVTDSGAVVVRTHGDELQHWISVCWALSFSPSPRAPPGFVTEASYKLTYFSILNWESNKWKELHTLAKNLLDMSSCHCLGRLWQAVWEPDKRREVTVTSVAQRWCQISHFMISIHYEYVYI